MKLLKVYISEKDKQGNDFIAKNGSPYSRVAIQTAETGEKWASNNIFNKQSVALYWKIGQDVDINLEENGQYLNWQFIGRELTTTEYIIEKLDTLNKKFDKAFPEISEDEEVLKACDKL